MYLNQSIEDFLNETNGIHDRDGRHISAETIRRTFYALRRALLSRTPDGVAVGIALERDWRYIVAMLVCTHAGITWVPMSTTWPAAWSRQLVESAGVELLLVEGNRLRDGVAPGLPWTDFDDLVEQAQGVGATSHPSLSPHQPAYIRFTSGSTGKPKGAIISRRALENHFRWIAGYFPLTQEDRMLFVSQLTFDLSILDVGLLVLKKPDFFFSKFTINIHQLISELETLGITTIVSAPNLFNLLLQDSIVDRLVAPQLKTVIIAGSRFPYGLYQNIKRHLPKVTVDNAYGPTEATNLVSTKRLTWDEEQDLSGHNVSIGAAVPNTALHLFDPEWRQLSSPGQTGELLISGIQLMDRYVNDPERTAESLVEIENTQYYRSGDLAYFDDKGDFYIVGRVGDTVKVKGHRVNLLDIDAQLQAMDGVQDCATIAVDNSDLDTRLVTYIILRPETTIGQARRYLMSRLPREQIPQVFVPTETLPVNDSGKVDRKALAELFKNHEA